MMNIDQLRANPMLATVVPIQKILRVSNAGHAHVLTGALLSLVGGGLIGASTITEPGYRSHQGAVTQREDLSTKFGPFFLTNTITPPSAPSSSHGISEMILRIIVMRMHCRMAILSLTRMSFLALQMDNERSW